ncbi:MAG: hypothetical protein HY925_12170, partial [Elusimicrobia bacterium]|nr:hypothetical protein [Elusimicrobiota bacterium]
ADTTHTALPGTTMATTLSLGPTVLSAAARAGARTQATAGSEHDAPAPSDLASSTPAQEKKGCGNSCATCPLAATCKSVQAQAFRAAQNGESGGRRLIVIQDAGKLQADLQKNPEGTLGRTFENDPKAANPTSPEAVSDAAVKPQAPVRQRCCGAECPGCRAGQLRRERRLQREAAAAGTDAAAKSPVPQPEFKPVPAVSLAQSARLHAETSVYPDTFFGRAHKRFDAWLARVVEEALTGSGGSYDQFGRRYRSPRFPSMRRR